MNLQEQRERFEAWFKITYPVWKDSKDTWLKHQLWTAWQVAAKQAEAGASSDITQPQGDR